jgi:hypothetical protein
VSAETIRTGIALLALAFSAVALLRDELREQFRRHARIEVWQRNAYNEIVGAPRQPTDVTLLFRNLTPRPTAIVDVYVRDAGGGILNGRGYGKVRLPLKVDAWGVAEVTFPLAPADEDRVADIFVLDLDGEELVLPQQHRAAGWTRSKAQRHVF